MNGESRRPMDWEALLLRNENHMYRAALAVLGNREEAKDAVQDALVRYLEKRPALNDEEHERAWLLRVTVNGCKSRLRSPWRKRRVELCEVLETAEDSGAHEELLEMEALPPQDRAAIHLHYYEGYTTAEIAAMTGEAEGTVRSRLYRARQKLRRLLEGEE